MEAAASSKAIFLLLLLPSQPNSKLVHNCKLLSAQKHKQSLTNNIRCTNTSSPSTSFDSDGFPILGREAQTTIPEDKFPIEKRRRSEIVRERKSSGRGLVKKEPPNFEIGWKRTKEIPTEVPTGYVIMDFLEKLVGLMDMEFGSTGLLAKTGEIVAERVREEAEVLLEEGKVEERMVTELFRVLKLMEMDLAMLKASVKETTLSQRLQQAKARCRSFMCLIKETQASPVCKLKERKNRSNVEEIGRERIARQVEHTPVLPYRTVHKQHTHI